MNKNTGKLLAQTFNMLFKDLYDNQYSNFYIYYNYYKVLESVITEIKNEYYKNKKILYNSEVYYITENESFFYVSLVKNNQQFIGTLEQVHEWII